MTHDQKESRQIIVSGATGFIGQHLIPVLLAEGYDVIATARRQDKAQEFAWYEEVTFIPLDFHKSEAKIPFAPGAGLIHLAWQGLPDYKSLTHFEENLPSHCRFIKDLVHQGVRQILVTGTCLEYGHQSGPLPPTTRPQPCTPYALAKDCLRQYLELLAAEMPFTHQWARLFYMYGKGQNPKSILAQLDAAIARGETEFKMSGGEQLRDYLPIESVVQKIFALYAGKQAGVYNISSGQPISVRRLVDERITERQSVIRPKLGHYPYPDYEPMAFWGV